MTAPYKKRAKAGWNNDKEQSNKDERAFVKQELTNTVPVSADVESLIIKNEIIEDEHMRELAKEFDLAFKQAKKKSKKRQVKAKDIRNKIHSVEQDLVFWKSRISDSKYYQGIVQRYTQELKMLNEQLLELEQKDKK